MGQIFEMKAGVHVPAAEISAQPDSMRPYPCFGGNGIRGFVSHSTHDGVHLLIGRQGALCGNVKRASGRFFATEHAVVITPKVDVDMDWAFHILEVMNLNQYATKSAQPGLAVGTLARVVMPLPPIEAQRRAAAMLDKFDALVNDLSVGLPAELVARRRQYEHYRDRLLTFEEAA
jgi:type I restriction enzyme S subunit